MLTVTDAAKERLKEILKERDSDPSVTIRITASLSTSNKFDLVFDKENEGDFVVKTEEGRTLLVIEPDLAKSLKGKTVDYTEKPQGAGFTIS